MKKQCAKPKAKKAIDAFTEFVPYMKALRPNLPVPETGRPRRYGLFLAKLNELGKLSQDQIAIELQCEPRNVVRMISWARENDLINAEPVDGELFFSLNEKGRLCAELMMNRIVELDEAVAEALTPEQIEAVSTAFTKVRDYLIEKDPMLPSKVNALEIERMDKHLAHKMKRKKKACACREDEEVGFGVLDFDEEFDPEDFVFDKEELGFEIWPTTARYLIYLHLISKLIEKVEERGDVRLDRALQRALRRNSEYNIFHYDYCADPEVEKLTAEQINTLIKAFSDRFNAKNPAFLAGAVEKDKKKSKKKATLARAKELAEFYGKDE